MPNRSLWRPGYKFVVSAYHYMMVLHKVVSKVMALWLVWIVCTLHSWCHKIPSAIYVHSLVPNLAFYSSRQEQLKLYFCMILGRSATRTPGLATTHSLFYFLPMHTAVQQVLYFAIQVLHF